LDGRLFVLGVLHQPHHVGQLGIAPDARGPDDQTTADRDRAPHHPVAGSDVDGQGLAGHGAAIDGRGTEDDLTVGGHRLSRPHHEPVTDLELRNREPSLHVAGVEHGHVLGPHGRQRSQSVSRPPLTQCLEVPAGQEERGHGGGNIDIDGTPRLVDDHEDP
jgi:hypothetical protein